MIECSRLGRLKCHGEVRLFADIERRGRPRQNVVVQQALVPIERYLTLHILGLGPDHWGITDSQHYPQRRAERHGPTEDIH